jgi:hypothetical protein
MEDKKYTAANLTRHPDRNWHASAACAKMTP